MSENDKSTKTSKSRATAKANTTTREIRKRVSPWQ